MTRSRIHSTLILVLGVVFLFAGMAFAKTKQINLIYQSTVGKSLALKPGNYRIDVVNNKNSSAVEFFNSNGKLVGEVPAKVVTQSRKNNETMIDYNTVASNDHVITQISPGGWNEVLYFSQSGKSSTDSRK